MAQMHPELLDLLAAPARSMAGPPLAPDDLPPPDGAATATGLPDAIPAVLDAAGMAGLLGVSATRVTTLVRDGILIRVARGRYDVRASLLRYLARLRDHAGQVGRPTEGGDELRAAKLRVAREQAAKLELANAAARGELVPALEVERQWAGVLRDVRAALLAVPSRCGATMPHLTPQDVAAIDREIRQALEALANGN